MPLIQCPECGREISTAARFCPHCGVPNPGGAKASTAEKALAFAGAGTLFLGLFFPLITGPQNLFEYGLDWAILLISLASLALVLTFFGRERWLWVPGGLSGLIVGVAFLQTHTALSELRRRMTEPGSPSVQWIGEAPQVQWGWGVLVIGSSLLIAVGVNVWVRTRSRRRESDPPGA
jgi:hypothetical protein